MAIFKKKFQEVIVDSKKVQEIQNLKQQVPQQNQNSQQYRDIVNEKAQPLELEKNRDNTEFDEAHVNHFKPESYKDTKAIVDCLIRFKRVTVNLTIIQKEEKKRLIDFLTGVMYALDGDYKKVDDGVYQFWISN
ncbi:cell division inhibitor SepF [Spiroplasma gladiatoris]|uniref:Cell division inhibitor SepF n=1 Tax=Spiroplasma gladiatoris TaxID=2143 RepID=A0A4P7AHN8_9MOLU|nr:cell division protein SepF [Spiroplasma gladiatoris]QBQ07955.1 cell division inhibitor SepF [Spiroplasma gladiatoris]